MKELEKVLILLNEKSNRLEKETDAQKIIDALNISNNFSTFFKKYFGKFRTGKEDSERYKAYLINKVNELNSPELKAAYNDFIERNEIYKIKRYQDSSLKRRIYLLNKTLKDAEDGKIRLENSKNYPISYSLSLREKEKPYNTYSKKKTIDYFNSEEVSEEEKEIFFNILEKYQENIKSGISSRESIFYDELIKILRYNTEFTPKTPEEYEIKKIQKNIESISEPSKKNDKPLLDTRYAWGNNNFEDIDILITFKTPVNYQGKKIYGIGVACDGEIYHSWYWVKNNNKDKARNNVNDSIRHNSKIYKIFNWNEKDASSEEKYSSEKYKINSTSKDFEKSAEEFIKGKIVPALKEIFIGWRDSYDQTQQSNQFQQGKLTEIAAAINKNINAKNDKLAFIYNDINLNDLGYYFLLNKKTLAFDKNGQYDGNKVKLWANFLNTNFVPNDEQKKEIYDAIINNDKINVKRSWKEVNKKNRNFKLDVSNLNKYREKRQFAKLFKAIKKTSK